MLGERARALYVGPDEATAETYSASLERAGYAVDTAVSPASCVDSIAPDTECVVCSLALGDTSGLAVLGAVRESYPDLPFVLVARDGSEAVASDAIAAGVTDYLPADGGGGVPTDLIERVDAAVEGGRERTASGTEGRVLRDLGETVSSSDRSLTEEVESLLEVGREALGMDYATLSRVEGEEFVLEAVDGAPGVDMTTGDRFPIDATNCERVVEADETVVRAGTETDAIGADDPPVRIDGGVSRYIGTPVTDGTDVCGTLCFYAEESEAVSVSERDVAVVELLGRLVSDCIQRDRYADRLSSFEAAFPDVGLVLDADGRFRDCIAGATASALLYDDPEHMVGQTVHEVLPQGTADAIQAAVDEALDTGRLQSVEYELDVQAGTRYFEGRAAAVAGGEYGPERVVFVARDITERTERERRLERAETSFRNAQDGIFLVDVADGEFVIECVNPAYEALTGLAADDVRGRTPREVLGDEIGGEVVERYRECVEHGEPIEYVEQVPLPSEETHWKTKVAPIGEAGEVRKLVGATRDITERTEREEELAYRRALLEAQAETGIDGLLVVDSGRNVRYHNDRFLDIWNIPRSVADAQSDRKLLDAVRDTVADPEAFFEKVEHLYDNPEAVSRDTIRLEDGRYLDRYSAPVVDGETQYGRLWVFRDVTDEKEREVALKRQRDELAALHRVDTLIRGIMKRLQHASTRDEMETAVCAHLTETDLYQTAWIGTTEKQSDGDPTVTPRTASGVDDAYLEGIPQTNNPAARAARTGSVEVIPDVETDDGFPDSRREIALDHGHHALATVPLTTGDTTYGVLVVYAPREHVIDDEERAVLADLGRIVAYAIQRVQSQRSLTAESVFELRMRVEDTDLAYGRVTAELNCELRFERQVPTSGGSAIQYFTVRGAEPDRVADRLEAAAFVEACTVARRGDDGTGLLEVVVDGGGASPFDVVTNHGASLTEGRVRDGDIALTAEAAPGIDVRGLVGAIQAVAPGATLASKRLRDRRTTTVPEVKGWISDELTQKQEAALSAAYTRGYFEWPRESTAEEVAAPMDVSSATLHYHLRNGLQTLLSMYFEPDCRHAL
ncbi:PAS domain-containing protein [Haloarcula salina]|uniref:PAS domain-containing protein n=1 Tax=Haloarcula salina TaxID=1429914 RepID=A0AA41G3F6_9EURY|nr:PAS domain-containing protein [Haloarcula salina]MBV0902851.1 PAS domain-containing protein [Haloarcula salina]